MAHDHIEVRAGTDERIRVTVSAKPQSEWDGLGDDEVWWLLVNEPGGDSVMTKYSGDPDLTVTQDGGPDSDGRVLVDLFQSETEALERKTYYHELVTEDDSGSRYSTDLEPVRVKVVESSADQV